MSQEVTVRLPKLGESIISATIVKWLKKEGDSIGKDEALLEVSTDKVNSEIPSPVSGTIKEILADIDEEVSVDAPLAVIDTEEKNSSISSEQNSQEESRSPSCEKEDSCSFLSPAVLRLAGEANISMQELENIPRNGSRLSKKDVEAYINSREKPQLERKKMSQMRKKIAEQMVRSFYEAPHASLITEVDVTNILKMIRENKEGFFAKHGAKLSITAFIAQALAKAVADYPLINSSLEADTIVVKHFVNLGVAVHIENGLQVPVIKQAQQKSLPYIAQEIFNLAKKAREGTLLPDEIREGTLTLTNFGMTGTLIGIPIIRFPEVAIVGVGSIEKKVVPTENDDIIIRSKMMVSLTFDHRVLDGIYGCKFLERVKSYIENKDDLV